MHEENRNHHFEDLSDVAPILRTDGLGFTGLGFGGLGLRAWDPSYKALKEKIRNQGLVLGLGALGACGRASKCKGELRVR